jgi:protocatechuate 3,4-dioxygenase beta subunit
VRRASIVLVVVAAGCGGSDREPRTAAKPDCKPTPGGGARVSIAGSAAESRVRLGPAMELKATKRNLAAGRVGKPLVVTGTVRGEDCAPLAGATINAWQTNGNGRYGPRRGGRDVCCYLAGTVRTGDDGRYTLDTVMPRGYDGGPAHIHMEAGHPGAVGLVTELLFGNETNPQAVTVEVRDGTAELDIVLRDS